MKNNKNNECEKCGINNEIHKMVHGENIKKGKCKVCTAKK